jgi:hypothetical protein
LRPIVQITFNFHHRREVGLFENARGAMFDKRGDPKREDKQEAADKNEDIHNLS